MQWDLAQLAKHKNKKWALQTVLGSRIQVLLEVGFLLYFSALIQFWQIWQNDLFAENLDYHLCYWHVLCDGIYGDKHANYLRLGSMTCSIPPGMPH